MGRGGSYMLFMAGEGEGGDYAGWGREEGDLWAILEFS